MEIYDKERKGHLGETEITNILIDIYRHYNKTFTPTKADIDGFVKLLDHDEDRIVSRFDIENNYRKYMITETPNSNSYNSDKTRKRSKSPYRAPTENSEKTPSNYDSESMKGILSTLDDKRFDGSEGVLKERGSNNLFYFQKGFQLECDEGNYMSVQRWQSFKGKYASQIGMNDIQMNEIYNTAVRDNLNGYHGQNMVNFDSVSSVINRKFFTRG